MNGAIGLKANAWSTNNSYDIEITSIPLMEGTIEPFEGMTVTFKVSKVTLMAYLVKIEVRDNTYPLYDATLWWFVEYAWAVHLTNRENLQGMLKI